MGRYGAGCFSQALHAPWHTYTSCSICFCGLKALEAKFQVWLCAGAPRKGREQPDLNNEYFHYMGPTKKDIVTLA